MLRFIAGRLALIPLMLLGVSAVVFAMLRLGRGDPALDYLRLSQIPPTDAAIAKARVLLGLDRPLVEQYLTWLWDAVRLDFGVSYATRRPVLDEFLYYLPATLQLAAVALVVTLAVSLPLGIWAARHPDKLPDQIVRGIAFIGVSMPNFWLGFLLVMVFSVWLGLLPPLGKGGVEHMLMPVLAVSLMSLSINARMLRTSMLEAGGQRHVLYARLRGLSDGNVTRHHILRNALLPIVTATGMHIGELIGGTLVVENIFGWPGLGRYAVSAIYNRDFPVLQCFVLLMTLIFVLCNLVIDILYAWLDPRIRMFAERSR
ncbi:nickel ABC transporter permease subunit NikB [Taklimakanibacter albus]|uniref:Nickel ABC transporter permease subunit NikB n=1 Tax=Taklimakanibacter albus TaxID=2800327 RepID=A0ACC5RDW8_9HYPH|nr:nickel ABC transporter permease subunit NikB [Aestuariivirga sp. YIM B02566]MBK1870860.1 nickel ABC transporter permease subunit NikB [Aestuariivirga sp. YIM B02566]